MLSGSDVPSMDSQGIPRVFPDVLQVKTFMLRASQSVESLELRVDEVGSKADDVVTRVFPR